MIGFLRRHSYGLILIGLLSVILVAGAFILAVAMPDLLRRANASASPAPTSPSPSPATMAWVGMPADADCSGCHVTDAGSIGLRPVPPIAHPLEGWASCNECHASDRLVDTAPGHAGIHAPDCLTCHQPVELPPPLSRPHRDLQNQACLACHGTTAPLPPDMSHRPETVCWLCHRLPEQPPPVPRHRVLDNQADCLRCHVEGVVGALPADHATRSPSECLLCHEPQPGGADQPTVRVRGPTL